MSIAIKVPGISPALQDVFDTFSSPVPIGRSDQRQLTFQCSPLGVCKVFDLFIVPAAFSTVHGTVSSPSVTRKPTVEGGLSLFFGSLAIVVV